MCGSASLTVRNIADTLLAERRVSDGGVASGAGIRNAVSRYECIELAIPVVAFDASDAYAPISAVGGVFMAFLVPVTISHRSVHVSSDSVIIRSADEFRKHSCVHGS